MRRTAVLLGDEAIALGAVHAGLSGVYGYPGTPSTEIFEAVEKIAREKSIHATWSSNEKVAYEQALGMCYAGKRAMVTMKHVGLNVAADPFMSSAITGVNGGLVVVVADDPGMHSSQNEQDTRYLAQFAMVPLLEPATQQEAYDMTLQAFAMSEELNVPVIVRVVTRLAHSRANIQVQEEGRPQSTLRPSTDHPKWTLLPGNARKNYARLVSAQAAFLKQSEESRYNTLRLVPGTRKGILCTGIAANYLYENLPESQSEYSVLEIRQYPAPVEKIRKLMDAVDDVLVLEEGYPFIEHQLQGLIGHGSKIIRGKLTGHVARTGELDPDVVRRALGLEAPEALSAVPKLVVRPPQLCSGCAHGTMFDALREAIQKFPEGKTFGDIGCYALGALPPYNALESCVDMGASISMATGAAHAGVRPSIAVIGDSTFTHSGLTGLLDAIRENTPVTVLLLDNSAVAMTGTQEPKATGESLVQMIRGLGLPDEHIVTLEPFPKNHADTVKAIDNELRYEGVSVILAQRECLESIKKRKRAEA